MDIMDGAVRVDGGPSAAIFWLGSHLNPVTGAVPLLRIGAPYSVRSRRHPLRRMIHSRGLLLALILGLPAVGCRQSDNSVVGRWQRTNQPSEWFQFEHDNTFTARSYGLDTSVLRGSFAQRGTTVTVTSKYGHTRTLELGDSLLVMEDGTKYRRVK